MCWPDSAWASAAPAKIRRVAGVAGSASTRWSERAARSSVDSSQLVRRSARMRRPKPRARDEIAYPIAPYPATSSVWPSRLPNSAKRKSVGLRKRIASILLVRVRTAASAYSTIGPALAPRAQMTTSASSSQRGKKSTPVEAVITQRSRPGQLAGTRKGASRQPWAKGLTRSTSAGGRNAHGTSSACKSRTVGRNSCLAIVASISGPSWLTMEALQTKGSRARGAFIRAAFTKRAPPDAAAPHTRPVRADDRPRKRAPVFSRSSVIDGRSTQSQLSFLAALAVRHQ